MQCSLLFLDNDDVHSMIVSSFFDYVLDHVRLCLMYTSADACLRMKSVVVVIQTRNTAVLTALGAILFIHLHSIGKIPPPPFSSPCHHSLLPYSRMNHNFEDKDAVNQPLLFHSMSTDDDNESIHKCSPSSRSKWFAVPAVEDQGIKPVSENERTHTRIIDNFTFWFSIASNVLTMALGVLGVQLFGLEFKAALGCIILANLSNSLPGMYLLNKQALVTHTCYCIWCRGLLYNTGPSSRYATNYHHTLRLWICRIKGCCCNQYTRFHWMVHPEFYSSGSIARCLDNLDTPCSCHSYHLVYHCYGCHFWIRCATPF